MTQTEFNNKVIALQARFAALTNIAATMDNTKDPYAEVSRHRQRFLANIISALDGYDITSEILTEDQILFTFELGICAGQSCSV